MYASEHRKKHTDKKYLLHVFYLLKFHAAKLQRVLYKEFTIITDRTYIIP